MDISLVNILNGAVPFWVLKGSVPATLDFDFANGRYYQQGIAASPAAGNVITTSRASTGYASDTSGNYTSFANNVARITNQGLLVEEARTNGFLQSNTFATSPWAATNVSAVNGAGISPDGGNNASSIIDTAANALHQFGQSPSVSMTTGTVVSVFVRPAAQTWAGIQINNPGDTSASEAYFNLSGAGSVGSITTLVGSATIASSSITAYSNGWYRIAVVTTGTNATMFIGPASGDNGRAYAGTGTVSLYCWAAQSEAGGLFPTSPIITTTAAVTRAADVVTVTNPPGFGGSATVFGRGVPQAPTSYGNQQSLIQIDDGSANNRIQLRRQNGSGSPVVRVVIGGSTLINAGIGTWNQSADGKFSGSQAPNAQLGVFSGTTTSTTGAGAMAGVNRVLIGIDQSFVNQFNGYIERIAIWPSTALPATNQIQITSP